MYNKIINPINKKVYSINSKTGKKILNKYIQALKGGASETSSQGEPRRCCYRGCGKELDSRNQGKYCEEHRGQANRSGVRITNYHINACGPLVTSLITNEDETVKTELQIQQKLTEVGLTDITNEADALAMIDAGTYRSQQNKYEYAEYLRRLVYQCWHTRDLVQQEFFSGCPDDPNSISHQHFIDKLKYLHDLIHAWMQNIRALISSENWNARFPPLRTEQAVVPAATMRFADEYEVLQTTDKHTGKVFALDESDPLDIHENSRKEMEMKSKRLQKERKQLTIKMQVLRKQLETINEKDLEMKAQIKRKIVDIELKLYSEGEFIALSTSKLLELKKKLLVLIREKISASEKLVSLQSDPTFRKISDDLSDGLEKVEAGTEEMKKLGNSKIKLLASLKLEKKKTRRKNLKKNLKKIDEQLADLQQNLDQLKSRNRVRLNILEKMRDEFYDKTMVLKKILSSKDIEISEIMAEVTLIETTLEDLRKQKP